MKTLIVLCEDERFYLPHLLANLARRRLIGAILVYRRPFSIRALSGTIRRLLAAFGAAAVLRMASDTVLAVLADCIFRHKFYSVRKVAEAFGIPLHVVEGLNSERVLPWFRRYSAEVCLAHVTEKIRPDLLAHAVFWNKHAGLLPSDRGIFPVYWSMLHREPFLGVTVHVMDEDFDTGEILSQAAVRDEGKSLFAAYHDLYDLSARLIAELCLSGPKSKVDLTLKPSYHSFPREQERNLFLKIRRFGSLFRLHPSVEPEPARTGAP